MFIGVAAISSILAMAVTALVPGQVEPAITPDTVVRFDFDTAPDGRPDLGPWADGCFSAGGTRPAQACVAAAGGGMLNRIERPGVQGSPALVFPSTGNGRAILEITDSESLNPAAADFSVTATVLLHDGKRMPNLNIVQKGYFDGSGGQWKLQADLGLPTCRISGTRDGAQVSAMAQATESIAGRGWVRLHCQRIAGVLSITVDDAAPVPSGANAEMDISSGEPVRIGGKDTSRRNDQWLGSIDDVAITVATPQAPPTRPGDDAASQTPS